MSAAESAPPTHRSIDEVSAWIAARLAQELGIAVEEITPSQPFDRYGLDSLSAALIAAELEDWIGCKLSSALLYQCPTLETVSAYIAGVTVGATGPRKSDAAAPVDDTSEGSEAGLLALATGGKRLRFGDRIDAFARLRASLPPDAYLRVLDSAVDREVTVVERQTGVSRRMLMFGANNYLGLANHPDVVERARATLVRSGVGVCGSSVLSGYTSVHRQLEERIAAFKHTEDALVFPTGYAANLGVLTALPMRGDIDLVDEAIHSSIYDGLRLGMARFRTFAHNDVGELTKLLAAAKPEQDRFVVVEGVYSMDGDLAPLDRIVPACEAHGAILVVDDAHGTGVLGPGGRGTAVHFGVERRVPVHVGTFSKAFGAVGGFVAASRPVIDALRFLSRSYTFSSALPSVVAASVLAAMDVLEREPWRVDRLRENVEYARAGLERVGIAVTPAAAILPIPLLPGMNVREAAQQFHAAGVFVNPVEYPAVPRDRERIRATLSAAHTHEDIDRLIEVAAQIWAPFRNS